MHCAPMIYTHPVQTALGIPVAVNKIAKSQGLTITENDLLGWRYTAETDAASRSCYLLTHADVTIKHFYSIRAIANVSAKRNERFTQLCQSTHVRTKPSPSLHPTTTRRQPCQKYPTRMAQIGTSIGRHTMREESMQRKEHEK